MKIIKITVKFKTTQNYNLFSIRIFFFLSDMNYLLLDFSCLETLVTVQKWSSKTEENHFWTVPVVVLIWNCNINGTYWLIGFVSTSITGICSNHHHWFDLSCPGYNTFHTDQPSNRISLHFPDSNMFLSIGCFEIYFTETNPKGFYVSDCRHVHSYRYGRIKAEISKI